MDIGKETKKAVVLLSGGLDSSTALALILESGYECLAVSFDYGQKHRKELLQSAKIADHYGCDHCILKVPLDFVSTSALISPKIEVPEREPEDDIPPTWVPQRNSVFLSLAFAFAEVHNADVVVIGANQVDYSGYPDCREDYLTVMDNALNLGSKRVVEGGRRIHLVAPLLKKTKEDIVRYAISLKVPIHLTSSCYNGRQFACGVCETCRIRLAAFKKVGFPDPIFYENIPDEYKVR